MPFLTRLSALALLALAAPAATAQTPEMPPDWAGLEAPSARADDARWAPGTDTSAPTVAYQGVLSDGGAPVADGSYTVALGLYGVASGGAADYAAPHSVTTVDGAFSLAIGGGTPTSGSYNTITFADETWVEVAVGGTPLGPRTLIQAAPHARSLTAGAEVVGSVAGSALRVENTASSGTTYGVYGLSASTSGRGLYGLASATSGTTYGVYGRSESTGYAGYFDGGRGILVDAGAAGRGASIESDGGSGRSTSTLFAENTSAAAGIAAWFESNGTDATLVVAQDGSGDIVKAFSSGNLRFRIQNNGTVTADGSITGGGADFAEYVPLASSTAAPRAGDVVGVTAGRVGLATDEAEQVMIVSSNPAFVGNPDAEDGGTLVALVGQAEVRLASSAQIGDLLVASGRSDGTARAVSPARYDPATDGVVIGRVLELVENGLAVALVGIDEAAALREVVVRQQDQIESLTQRLDALERLISSQTASR